MDPVRHDLPASQDQLTTNMKTDPPTTREAYSPEDTPDMAFPYHANIAADMRAGQTSVGVVLALAELLERPPGAMPPLHTAVDCDALDQMFRPRHTDDPPTNMTVTIPYAGYTVAITADGRLRIRN